MLDLKLSLLFYLVNAPKNRVFLVPLPTSLPRQAELFFLLFSLFSVGFQSCWFSACTRQAGMSSVLAFMHLAWHPLCVAVDTFALHFLKVRKRGSWGEGVREGVFALWFSTEACGRAAARPLTAQHKNVRSATSRAEKNHIACKD